MQVGAALAVYAAACVPECDTAMAVPKQANELLATVHQHAGLLLQTASHMQVMISAIYRCLPCCPIRRTYSSFYSFRA